MRTTAFIFLFLVQCSLAFGDESGRPTGENCNLTAPPDSAGEEFNRGTILRIYPRALNIGVNYSGCQLRWAPDKERWNLISIVAIESGDPVRVWSPFVSDPALMGCIYEKGKVVKGNAQKCAAPQFLVAKSQAPGCIAKTRKAAAEGGLAAAFPPGCEYE